MGYTVYVRCVCAEDVRNRATLLLKVWKARAKKAMRRRARRVETYGRSFAE